MSRAWSVGGVPAAAVSLEWRSSADSNWKLVQRCVAVVAGDGVHVLGVNLMKCKFPIITNGF